MVGLTYTPPVLPSVAASASPTTQLSAAVTVLSARAPGAIQDSLANTLRDAVSPGNILTGTVSSAIEGQSFTLSVKNGIEVTLPYPPQVTLTNGSTVTLRINLDSPAPQATLLSVDGRPVSIRIGPGGGGGGNIAAPVEVAVPLTQGAALPGSGSASAYAASLAAVISLEDEAVIEAALTEQGEATGDPQATAEPLLGVLLRAAAVPLGQAPLLAGTRYLLSLGDLTGDNPGEAPPQAAEISAWLDQLDPSGATDFRQQTALLTGRVLPPRQPGETLVETAIGTIAIAMALPLPAGAAIRLRVAAVAGPVRGAGQGTAGPANSQTLPEELLDHLSNSAPGLIEAFLKSLTLPTDDTLLGAAWRFLADPNQQRAAKALLDVIGAELADAGKAALASRLGAAAAHLGDEAQPQTLPGGWSLFTLPFLGTGSQEPVRVFVKAAHDERREKGAKRQSSSRVVLEVTLRRLGPLQVDGLVRDRRFDMVLRTEHDLETELQSEIQTGFHEALASCSWNGDVGFGKIGHFPLFTATADPVAGVGLSV